jgi:hypothetical protein
MTVTRALADSRGIDETALGGSLRTCECTGLWIAGAFVTCVYGDNASGTVRHLLIFFLTERRINLLSHSSMPPRRQRGESSRNHGENNGMAIVRPSGISLRIGNNTGTVKTVVFGSRVLRVRVRYPNLLPTLANGTKRTKWGPNDAWVPGKFFFVHELFSLFN